VSFILDALRKSDHRRNMDKSPGLQTAHSSSAPRRRRKGWFAVGLMLLLIAAAGIAVVSQRDRLEPHWQAWLGGDEQQSELPDPPEPMIVSEAGERTETRSGNAETDPTELADRQNRSMPRERVVTDPDEARAEIERMIAERRGGGDDSEQQADNRRLPAVDRRAPTNPNASTSVAAQDPERPHVRPPDPAEAERIQRQLLEAQRRREAEQADEKTGTEAELAAKSDTDTEAASSQPPYNRIETPADNPADTQWTPQASEYVRAWELPLSIRRNMPALSLTIHVFAERLEDRFVLINGERFVTGDDLADGARLVDIRREGAVVDYRDYRFLLEP